jgi:Tfp pilus assembly protein PilF
MSDRHVLQSELFTKYIDAQEMRFFVHPRLRQLMPLMFVLASACVAVGAYLQALNYPFISDDVSYLPENTRLIGLHLADLWRLLIEPYNCCREYLPLRDFSYWLDIKLFGLTPSAFRGHNILLYLVNLPLVYATTLAFWKYFRPADAASAPWAAAAVTALFALHPALVESVVWISGRKYVLPNLFALLALWLAARARRQQGLSVPHAATALIALVAMMLSKASYVGVAPLIALLWLLFWLDIPAPGRRLSLLLWPLAALLLAGLLTLIFVVQNKGFDAMPFYFGIEALARTFAVLGWLAFLAFSTGSRHYLYPVFEDPNLPLMVAIGVVVLLSAATSGLLLLRKRSLEGFALAAFLLLCMPYIQLMPNHPPSLVSDRYLALAVWPAILFAVALLWRLKPVPRMALLLAFALLWGFQTIERPRDWRLETLFDADLRAYPGYYMPAMYEINYVKLPQGLYPEAYEMANSIPAPEFREVMIEIIKADYAVHAAISTGKPEEAMSLLWSLAPSHKERPAQAKWNSSAYFFYAKRLSILVKDWEKLAERFPDDVSLRYNAGLWMLESRKSKDAVVQLRAATESQRLPESVRGTAFKNLGLALLQSGRIAEAETPLRAALEQSPPDFRAYCLLSGVYKLAGRTQEAASAEAACRSRVPNDNQSK